MIKSKYLFQNLYSREEFQNGAQNCIKYEKNSKLDSVERERAYLYVTVYNVGIAIFNMFVSC